MTPPRGVRVRWTRVADVATRREAAWSLLRSIVGDPAARITNECERCGAPHGRVRVDADVAASVAYAGGFALVCVAATTCAAAVGIDAEPAIDDRRDAVGLAGVVRPGRTASVREWTRIEAVLKADGRGLRVDPSAVAVTESTPAHWRASIEGSERVFLGWDAPGPPGLIVSVAIEPVSGAADPAAPADPAMP